MEVDFLKKNQVSTVEQKRLLIESDHPQLSIVRQCELLGLARSSYSYEPVPISEEDLILMRLLDEHYTRSPFLWEAQGGGLPRLARIGSGSQTREAADGADGLGNDLSEATPEPSGRTEYSFSLSAPWG